MAAHNDSKMPGRSAKGKGGIELYSPTYFAACTLGGVIACGPTHTCQCLRHIRALDVTDAPNSCHTVRPRELSPRSPHSASCSEPSLKLRDPKRQHVDEPNNSLTTKLPGKMPPPSRRDPLHLEPPSLARHLRQRRPPRRLLRLVPHLRRLLLPRRRQIRLLRALQEPLRRENIPERQQDRRLPRRLGQRRVPGRYGTLSLRGDQGEDADDGAAVCEYVKGRVGEGGEEGGVWGSV